MRHHDIILLSDERGELTLETLASSAGLHPLVVERFVEFGLIDPVRGTGSRFDAAAIPRLKTIQRLRTQIGLPGISVILDLLDRLRTLQGENDRVRKNR